MAGRVRYQARYAGTFVPEPGRLTPRFSQDHVDRNLSRTTLYIHSDPSKPLRSIDDVDEYERIAKVSTLNL